MISAILTRIFHEICGLSVCVTVRRIDNFSSKNSPVVLSRRVEEYIWYNMPEFIEVLSKEEIESGVKKVAARISEDYRDCELVLVGALKGSFIFMADLARALSIQAKIDFIGVSSYGSGATTTGNIKVTKELGMDIKDKDVLIVEDIVDTGLTLEYIIEYLNGFGPRSVRVCTLLDKKERRETNICVDYACHMIPEGFLVGYGLDYAEEYRNMSAIYHLKL